MAAKKSSLYLGECGRATIARWMTFSMSICSRSSRAPPRSGRPSSTGFAAAWRPGSCTPVTTCREDLLDTAYGDARASSSRCRRRSSRRFIAPESHGQTGYTGLLVETAASSDVPDWKEMLNWGRELPAGHPLRDRYPHRYGPQVLPESAVPGIEQAADAVPRHDRGPAAPLPAGHRRGDRLPRVAVRRDDPQRRHADPRDPLPADDRVARRHPRVGRLARRHQPDHRAAAGHRAGAAGAGRRRRGSTPSRPSGQVIINTGMMLERLTNGVIPTGIHRVVAAPGYSGERYSVVQFCHPDAVDAAHPAGQLHHPRATRSASPAWSAPTRSTWCCTRSTSSRRPDRVG